MAKILNKISTFMAQIRNKLLTEFYDYLIRYHESRLGFRKELLSIKTDELTARKEKRLSAVNLKHKHKLSKLETNAGIESDYIKSLIEEKTEAVKNKVYWKNRVLLQKLKRAKTEEKKTYFNEKIIELEETKEISIQLINNKYLVKEPREADIALYKSESVILEKDRLSKIDKIESYYTNKIKAIHINTNQYASRAEEKIDNYRKTLQEKESSLIGSKDTIVLDNKIALSLRNLSMHFGGLKAVDDLSFDVKKGEIFGLIGPNGAGKTTVFNCITRFYRPTDGNMYFNNANSKTIHLNNVKVHNVIKQGIVRTFQNVELVWELNILDNLLVAAHSAYRSNFFGHSVHSRLTKREDEIFTRKAIKILNDLELTPYMYGYPIGLPYGVLKKIELARTLMSNPQLIILDEPAAGLNESETKELAAFIKKIKEEYKVTIFLVEHDMGLVMSICDTVCAISFGKKLALGTPQEIQKSKIVQEAYLGGE